MCARNRYFGVTPAAHRGLRWVSAHLTSICTGKYRAGRGYGRLEARVIEAWMTVTLADGTRRTELCWLMTSLLDTERHPAHELIELYHRRWQVERSFG